MPLMPPAALISLTASWLPLAASLSIDESAPVLPYGMPKRTVLPEAATGAVVGAADGTALGLATAAEGLATAAAAEGLAAAAADGAAAGAAAGAVVGLAA